MIRLRTAGVSGTVSLSATGGTSSWDMGGVRGLVVAVFMVEVGVSVVGAVPLPEKRAVLEGVRIRGGIVFFGAWGEGVVAV